MVEPLVLMHLLLTLLLAATWFTGPLDPWPDWPTCLGKTVTVRGVARDAKIGALLEGKTGTVWVDLEAWPSHLTGKPVQVTGKVISRNDLPLTDDPHSAGVTGPSSQRYLLTDVKVETTDTRP